jgi:putative endonuclease
VSPTSRARLAGLRALPGALLRGFLRAVRRHPSDPAQRLGRRGERVAARALRRAGYRILARNVRTPRGEVDLLAEDGPVLALVEVKSTGAGRLLTPEHRLRQAQRRRLVDASRWLSRRPGLSGRVLRRDLVTVAFGPGGTEVRIFRGRF